MEPCEHCGNVPTHFDAFGRCNSCLGINERFAFATLEPTTPPPVRRPLPGVSPSMITAAEQIAAGAKLKLQGLEIQTARVFLVFEPPTQGTIGGLVAVGEYTSADHFRILHGELPEVFSMYLAPILALGFAKIELQRASTNFGAAFEKDFKAAIEQQNSMTQRMLELVTQVDTQRVTLEAAEAEVARLRKALAATGGTPLENQFQMLPEQCDFTDPVHGRCTNKPTTTIPMQVAVCDAHREAETVEIGGVDVEPGTFN